jgi:hypothetical protein
MTARARDGNVEAGFRRGVRASAADGDTAGDAASPMRASTVRDAPRTTARAGGAAPGPAFADRPRASAA